MLHTSLIIRNRKLGNPTFNKKVELVETVIRHIEELNRTPAKYWEISFFWRCIGSSIDGILHPTLYIDSPGQRVFRFIRTKLFISVKPHVTPCN